jgi:hypothetical protein
MIKSSEKKHEFRKRRIRNKKRSHEDKKHKRSKKTHDSIIQKATMLFSENVSNEFSLSFARTVTTFERSSSPDQHHDSCARQLSNELKEARRQDQVERMSELTQSLRFIIDDMIRNEHDLDTSKRSVQSITFFTLINIRTQENLVDQMTSQLSSIVSSSIMTSNIMFDLEKFFSRLEAIIFERDEIEKSIFIDQVRADSQLKRIVLISFNENDVIMRRMIEYDNDEQKINVKNETYRTYREASLKTRNIIYKQK